MSTWIFKPLLGIALCSSLGACQSIGTSLNVLGGAAEAPEAGAQTTQHALPGGAIIVGPFGYCPDLATATGNRTQGTIAFASCVRVAGSDDFDSTGGHLLTATSFGTGSANLSELRDYVRSDAGQAAFAESGESGDVTLHDIVQTKAGLYIEHSDASRADHLGQRAWRGFVRVNGTTVMLSVYAGVGGSVAGDPGESIIRDFAAAIIDQNAPQT